MIADRVFMMNGSQVVAEAPVSAAVSALGGVCLYPLVGLQPGRTKFLNFVTTLVLEVRHEQPLMSNHSSVITRRLSSSRLQ